MGDHPMGPSIPVASEATTTSSWRPRTAPSVPCGTCCGRRPAPQPRRTKTAGRRCTSRRATATSRSAGCCWRRGPRWRPGIGTASWRRTALPVSLGSRREAARPRSCPAASCGAQRPRGGGETAPRGESLGVCERQRWPGASTAGCDGPLSGFLLTCLIVLLITFWWLFCLLYVETSRGQRQSVKVS